MSDCCGLFSIDGQMQHPFADLCALLRHYQVKRVRQLILKCRLEEET